MSTIRAPKAGLSPGWRCAGAGRPGFRRRPPDGHRRWKPRSRIPLNLGHTERAVLHAEEGAAGVLHREASVLEAPPRGHGRDARDLAAHTPAHHVVVRDAEEEGDGASAPEPVPSRHRVGPTRGDGLNLSHVSGRDGGEPGRSADRIGDNARQKSHTGPRARAHGRLGIGQGGRDGRLKEEVHPGPGRGRARSAMTRIGRTDPDGVQVLAGEAIVPVRLDAGAGGSGDSLGNVPARVTHRDQGRVGEAREDPGVPLAHAHGRVRRLRSRVGRAPRVPAWQPASRVREAPPRRAASADRSERPPYPFRQLRCEALRWGSSLPRHRPLPSRLSPSGPRPLPERQRSKPGRRPTGRGFFGVLTSRDLLSRDADRSERGSVSCPGGLTRGRRDVAPARDHS